MELVVASFTIDKPLRVLDFSRLERAHGEVLSYLQPDFNQQVERNHFLRRLHKLITQPVVPGREADYLITQTMAEYLSHVIDPPLDGVLFRSAQHEGGTNVVLFGEVDVVLLHAVTVFPVSYVPESIGVHRVEAVTYCHSPLDTFVGANGEVSVWDQRDDEDDL